MQPLAEPPAHCSPCCLTSIRPQTLRRNTARHGHPHSTADLPARYRTGGLWRSVFIISTLTGIFFLSILLLKIVNDSFGYIAVEYGIAPESLAVDGVPIWELPKEDLSALS